MHFIKSVDRRLVWFEAGGNNLHRAQGQYSWLVLQPFIRNAWLATWLVELEICNISQTLQTKPYRRYQSWFAIVLHTMWYVRSDSHVHGRRLKARLACPLSWPLLIEPSCSVRHEDRDKTSEPGHWTTRLLRRVKHTPQVGFLSFLLCSQASNLLLCYATPCSFCAAICAGKRRK